MNYVEATTKIVVAMIENGCVTKDGNNRTTIGNIASDFETIYNKIQQLETSRNDKNLDDYNNTLEEINPF